jgi:hypothetical protein
LQVIFVLFRNLKSGAKLATLNLKKIKKKFDFCETEKKTGKSILIIRNESSKIPLQLKATN